MGLTRSISVVGLLLLLLLVVAMGAGNKVRFQSNHPSPINNNRHKHNDIPSNCSQNLTITTQADIDNISNCTTFTSDLIILGPEIVNLPNLSILSGSIVINASSKTVNFSADALNQLLGLSYAYGLVVDSPPVLGSLSFKNLRTVGGQVYIANASALANVSLPALLTVAQRVVVAYTGIQVLSLPAFKRTMQTDDGPALTLHRGSLDFLRLRSGIYIAENERLTEVDLWSVELLSGDLKVIGNTAMKNFALPSLGGFRGELVLMGAFENIDFSSLASFSGAMAIFTTAPKVTCSYQNLSDLPGGTCPVNALVFSASRRAVMAPPSSSPIITPLNARSNANRDAAPKAPSHLSTASQVEIALGTVIAVLLITLASYCCCCRHGVWICGKQAAAARATRREERIRRERDRERVWGVWEGISAGRGEGDLGALDLGLESGRGNGNVNAHVNGHRTRDGGANGIMPPTDNVGLPTYGEVSRYGYRNTNGRTNSRRGGGNRFTTGGVGGGGIEMGALTEAPAERVPPPPPYEAPKEEGT